MNFAKVKSPVFIDAVKFQLPECNMQFSATLIDENGCICSQMETSPPFDRDEYVWKGLNNLPYGIYTLELSQGGEQLRLRMIKRV
jgi:hypothetical protein